MSIYGGPDIVTNGLVLHLDPGNEKSYPRVNGPELVTNSLVTVAGDGQVFNVLRNASVHSALYPLGTGITGRTYQITWTVTAQRATTSATLRNGAVYSINFNRVPGTYTATVTATATGTFGIYGDNAGTDFDLDYVSIKEIINSDGTMLYDLSGNNNHGTLINGPTFNISNNGRIVFDGIDDYIVINPNTSLYTNTQLTLTSVVQPTSFAANRSRLLDTHQPVGLDHIGTSFSLKIGTTAPFQDVSFFIANSSAVIEVKKTTSIITSTNQIYVISARWRGSDGTANIFVNGIEASYASSNTQTGTINNLLNNLYIGFLPKYNIYGNQRVYSTSIYNRFLSDNEILQNYNALKGRFGL